MKKRMFNALLKHVTTGKKLDLTKIPKLTDGERADLVRYIVRSRGPVVKDLIPPGFDMDWLRSCGYLYQTTGAEYTFVHTGEHGIK